uniref:PID domain-containing protein n=1 Tax=Amphiprion percula TaxID=161767 RepID=A0A3P8TZH3_AMPPE
MSVSSEDDSEISFEVKFLGRVQVVRPNGLQVLEEAAQSLKTPDVYSSEKATKKSKVHLFVSPSTIDILENKTKFLLYSCPLSTVSFCAVLPSSPKVFGFVAKHLAADTYHCYLFQSKKFVIPCAGLGYRRGLQSFTEDGGHQRRTGPDSGGAQTQGTSYYYAFTPVDFWTGPTEDVSIATLLCYHSHPRELRHRRSETEVDGLHAYTNIRTHELRTELNIRTHVHNLHPHPPPQASLTIHRSQESVQ